MSTKDGRPVALVTGGGSGVGASCAQHLAKAGHRIALVGRTRARLEETDRLIGTDSQRIIADLSRPEECRSVVREVLEVQGRVDVLVNNAGFATQAGISETSEELMRTALDTNLLGPMCLISELWDHFTERGTGCVVNISSLASSDPFPGFLAYAASKSGLDSLGRSIIAERPVPGIRAFTINLAAVETDMLRSMFDHAVVPPEACLQPVEVADFVMECIRGMHDERQGESIVLMRS